MPSVRLLPAFVFLALLIGQPARAQAPAEPAVALQGVDVVSYVRDGGAV
jgi:hypothetical protein